MSCITDLVSVSKRAEYAATDFSGAELSVPLLGAIRTSGAHGALLLLDAAARILRV